MTRQRHETTTRPEARAPSGARSTAPSDDAGALRRRTLLGGAAVGAASWVAGCSSDDEPDPTPTSAPEVFVHGVASGDPLPDGVVLWTRVTRRATTPGGPIEVGYVVATDAALTEVVAQGRASTDTDRDDTVKLDVTGLSPRTTYFYAFDALDERSPVGRTRTAPSGAVDRLRFAMCSCASFGHGYYNAYRLIARRTDLDLVIHLGDYIYEYGDSEYGDVRTVQPPHETVTLGDYRTRYAHHRSDPDLQEVHRQHPFVAVWDDHESANNAYADGAGNHDPAEGSWADRKAAAIQAYFEWMPIRDDASGQVQRVVAYGDLVDLIMLDTRLCCRDAQADGLDDPLVDDPTRSLLGAEQEAWLTTQLTASTAQWKLLGQQVMMGQAFGLPNSDQWDGYPHARTRLFELLRAEAITDVVVLTGDIHSSWAMDLTDDPYDPAVYDPSTGAGSVAVELVTPGVTSPGIPPELATLADGLRADNPHMKLVELTRRGYCVLDVTAARLQATWYHLDTVEQVSDVEMAAATMSVATGTARLVEDATGPAAPPDGPPPAP